MANATRHITTAKKNIPGKHIDLSVIIPAAGNNKRMKSKDSKVLSQIGDTTIIERQLNLIWKIYPKSEIFLVIGEQSDIIRKKLSRYPVRYIYNPIYDNTNVVFSLGLALQASINNHVLITYGDLIYNEQAIATITDGPSQILVNNKNTFNDDEVGVIVDESGYITNLSYGLQDKWAQIAYLNNKELDLFKQICYSEVARKWFGYEALNKVIEKNGVIHSHNINSALVFDIDTQQDLLNAQKVF